MIVTVSLGVIVIMSVMLHLVAVVSPVVRRAIVLVAVRVTMAELRAVIPWSGGSIG
jgi:hypothetical protein